MLEKDIEDPVCKYAREKYKALACKFTSPARRSVPDRIFFMFYDTMFLIEFKATGKKATPKQQREHAKLRARGFTVYVVDDIDIGKALVDRHGSLF